MLDQHPGDDDDGDDDLGLLLIVAQSLPEVSQGQVLNLWIQLSSVILLCVHMWSFCDYDYDYDKSQDTTRRQ